MKIKVYLLFALSVVFNNFTAQAQEYIDYENIFSLKKDNVAVPKGNTLHIYSLEQGNWTITDSLALPSNYLGLDGNIRRVYVLMESKIVFHGFYGERKDSLYFNDTIPKPKQSHWIRTPYSTEKDFYVYTDEKNKAFIKDGEQWYIISELSPLNKENRTSPLLSESAPFRKLYSFTLGNGLTHYIAAVFDDKISFHQVEINEEYMELIVSEFEKEGMSYPIVEELEFRLPPQAKTAIIFDYSSIGVVYEDHIRIYEYDHIEKRWRKNMHYPNLEL